jgi:hypothetical protein
LIRRRLKERNASLNQIRMEGINIGGEGGEEGCRSSAWRRRGLALELHAGSIDLQDDEGQPFDLEPDGLVVLELHGQAQHVVVEDPGLLQVRYEQDDGSHVLDGGVHG